MVQLCCLSAHRTLLSSPSLPSLLSPSCALTRDSLSVTRATPPVSSRRASHLTASFAAIWKTALRRRVEELYLKPVGAAHEHIWSPLSSSGSVFLALVYSASQEKPHFPGSTHTSARCSHRISTRGSKTVWHLCLQLCFIVLCLTSLSATSLLLSSLAALSIYYTGVELWRHACRQLSPVPPPAGLLLWVYFRPFPTLPWLP